MKCNKTHLVIVIITITFLCSFSIHAQESCNVNDISDELPLVPGSCTIFSASYGNTALFGNNEDYKKIGLYYWIRPRSDTTYGGVYFGFENHNPQGGVNEKGLAFDYNALPEAKLNDHPELPNRGAIMRKIQENCATVKEAITFATMYNWGGSISYQIHLADATGDAVVMSAGLDGELAFTGKLEGDVYLLSTNFNVANLENTFSDGYPCWRYLRADKMLREINSEENLTLDYFKYIAKATHIESGLGNTLYSYIIDLKRCLIYIYYWHQYDEVALLNVAEEIAKEAPPLRIENLFSPKTIKKAENELQDYIEKGIE
ncbi:MAG: carcinine hydrolase/isopenicillin-N N-acyltransferase family protein [candidate division Zixibacteria bacterium]